MDNANVKKQVTLNIPDVRDPSALVKLLRLELALALYSDGILTPSRAAELAGMGRWEFGDFAKARQVATPYTMEMLREDFTPMKRPSTSESDNLIT